MGNFFGSAKRPREADKPDTVYVHQFSRWSYGPCMSMPCTRLESFLRLHKIPHVIIPSLKSGPHGRWPWARYNGVVLTDSQLIIEHLCEKLDINEGLTEEQQGVALTIERTLDFHVQPFAVRWAWVDNFEMVKKFGNVKIGGPQFLTTWLQWYVRKSMLNYLNTGGWGDYSDAEYRKQWVQDISAIAKILGTKEFLFGDKITRTDASVFAFLWNFLALIDTPYCYDGIRELIKDGTPLNAYLKRMEARLYPDMGALRDRAGSKTREVYPSAITM